MPKKRRPQFLDRPTGAKHGDVFEYNRMNFTLPWFDLRCEDVIAVYLTTDIETGDCITLRYDGETFTCKVLAQTALHRRMVERLTGKIHARF
jgi:hypothetical protein